MEYKIKHRRTTTYVGSVQNPYTDEHVVALKTQVRNNNEKTRAEARSRGWHRPGLGSESIQRVTIKPRGPRKPGAYHTEIKDARYFDIYLLNDSNANWNMKEELSNR